MTHSIQGEIKMEGSLVEKSQSVPAITGIKVGYIRVSSIDQNLDRQLEGCTDIQKIFSDKCSGKDDKRPQFQAMIDYVREGDTIYVHSLDRFARNLDDIRMYVQLLIKKGVKVHFIKENLIFSGEASPMAMFLLSVMGSFAEFIVTGKQIGRAHV